MSAADTIGVLLAGGAARRMGGGDKGMIELDGRPLLAWAIERAAPQVASLIINAGGDPARFAPFGLDVVEDTAPGRLGPLAGVLAAMRWAQREAPGAARVLSLASDTPFFPRDLRARLEAAATPPTPIVCAESDGRRHPVFALWPIALADALERALIEDGVRKIEAFTTAHGMASVAFSSDPIDPFFNLNRPEDVEAARAMSARV